ncbi:MAG: CIS tube protein [Solirubrobacteraceae bacterium]
MASLTPFAWASGFAKASIVDTKSLKVLVCKFNPKELSIRKSGRWYSGRQQTAPGAPAPDFISPEPRSLDMELFFDDWEALMGDVSGDVDQLLKWTSPSSSSLFGGMPENPPILDVFWGAKKHITGYLESVSARYTLFRRDGTPVRATVNVTFKEVPEDAARQNPTSGGPAGRRTHLLGDGDTLQSVAYAEYGDASLWRGLAAANDVDDPLRLASGTRVLVPPISDARALS